MAPITNVGPNVKRQRFGKDLAMQFPKNKEVKLNLTKEQELKVEGWNSCAKAGTLIENKSFGFWGAPKAPLNLNRDQKIMAEFKECGGNQPPVWEEKGSVVATLNLNRSQVTKAETKKPGDVEEDFVNVVIEADDSYEKVDMYEAEMSEWEEI